MNLNHYLASGGITSRRKAVQLILEGGVTVNGILVKEPSYEVQEGDKVCHRNKLVVPQKFVYIMVNKPAGVVTSVSDDRGRKTVLDLIGSKGRQLRVFPVGRLDYDTEGLLLLTNDGELTQILTHPRFEVKKKYKVVLDRPLAPFDRERILKGLMLRDGFIAADSVGIGKYNGTVVEIALHSGRNRIVRRIFGQLGYHVQELQRTGFATLVVKGLAHGGWRMLTKDELERMDKFRTRAEKITGPKVEKKVKKRGVTLKVKAAGEKMRSQA